MRNLALCVGLLMAAPFCMGQGSAKSHLRSENTPIVVTTPAIPAVSLAAFGCTATWSIDMPGAVAGRAVLMRPAGAAFGQPGVVAQAVVQAAGTALYRVCSAAAPVVWLGAAYVLEQ